MGGKGARARRQEKRAALLDRGLVAKEDLETVVGMKLEDAAEYAASRKLIIRIHSVDSQPVEKTNDAGPHALVVDLVDGKIAKAKARRHLLLPAMESQESQ
jgi:hypothetical protein